MTAITAELSAQTLIALGERANARRSFLLVSKVLGKHVPLAAARCRLAGASLALTVAGDPRAAEACTVLASGDALAAGRLLEGLRAPLDCTVVGFAETATGLAHQVAETLDAAWLQDTTRHPDAAAGLAFDEAHSHAREQFLLPLPEDAPGPLIIVDDELSTGATAARLIALLHAARQRERYVLACLVDARREPGPLAALASELGVPIEVVSLARFGEREFPAAGWSGGALPVAHEPGAGAHSAGGSPPLGGRGRGGLSVRDLSVAVPARAERHGLNRDGRRALREAAAEAAALTGELPPGSLVLGCGEHLALPQLAALAAGPETLVSSTTRSPALVADAPGYPLTHGLAFAHPEAPALPGYAYNVRPHERPRIVIHFAEPAHRAAAEPLLAALGPHVTAVTLA
jgi:hypothetical protein